MSETKTSFIHAGSMEVAKGWLTPLHSHPHLEVLLVLEGRLKAEIDGSELEAAKGDCLYYRPGAAHREKAVSDGGASFVFILFPAARALPRPQLFKDPGRRLLSLAAWIAAELSGSHEGRDSLASAYAEALLLELERLLKTPPPSSLSSLRSRLLDNLKRKSSVASLAKSAGMSKFHFIRSYKRHTGLTPMQDLMRMRLDACCNLLLTSELTLKQIAIQTGFCDEYYLSRAFRKHLKTTPGRFRGSILKG